MYRDQHDIVFTDHCVENDTLDEAILTFITRRENSDYSLMQAAAIDTYNKEVMETGDRRAAENKFFQIHYDYHVRN